MLDLLDVGVLWPDKSASFEALLHSLVIETLSILWSKSIFKNQNLGWVGGSKQLRFFFLFHIDYWMAPKSAIKAFVIDMAKAKLPFDKKIQWEKSTTCSFLKFILNWMMISKLLWLTRQSVIISVCLHCSHESRSWQKTLFQLTLPATMHALFKKPSSRYRMD